MYWIWELGRLFSSFPPFVHVLFMCKVSPFLNTIPKKKKKKKNLRRLFLCKCICLWLKLCIKSLKLRWDMNMILFVEQNAIQWRKDLQALAHSQPSVSFILWPDYQWKILEFLLRNAIYLFVLWDELRF